LGSICHSLEDLVAGVLMTSLTAAEDKGLCEQISLALKDFTIHFF